MKAAIDETSRRRKIQQDYNQKHGITPQSIQKAIQDTRLAGSKKSIIDEEGRDVDVSKLDKKELKFYLDELEEQMELAAKNLDFELAAKIRDRIDEIKKLSKLQKR